MKVNVYNIDGAETGEQIELSPDVFEADPNEHVLYLAVKAHLANPSPGDT